MFFAGLSLTGNSDSHASDGANTADVAESGRRWYSVKLQGVADELAAMQRRDTSQELVRVERKSTCKLDDFKRTRMTVRHRGLEISR